MLRKIKAVITLLKRAVDKFNTDNPVWLAGTTAYFAIFAIAPIIIIIISVAGFILNEETVRQKVFEELNKNLGQQGAKYIRTLISNYHNTNSSIIGTIVGSIAFLVTSTTFFSVLQGALNFVWKIKARPRHNLLKLLQDRALSFGLILILGIIMMALLFANAGLAFLHDFLYNKFPHLTVFFFKAANFILSFAITMLIFAIIYKFLPDAKIRWKVTWTGAFITALLFTVGKYLIGLFLRLSHIGVAYGTAGSLVIILLWVYYSSLIFFFGAEVTEQYAEMHRHRMR